ncbi:DUF134 domain-containing protein [Methanosarcina sp. MSH10X1]|uniref:DUF134 domain-containing protein n=1 Tax=Methanosarcina sp. MSH10X1 TaxID=2507075 RepID=UPI000FFC322D|nr:DUF134 domain-containing protein [Methanosarcina sp. MSH10X1]
MVNKVKRRVSCFPKATYFKPREVPLCCLEIATLSIEEIEAIRLCDLLQMEQNEAANRMGVSRKTFWSDLQKARQKIADALVNGKAIEISGGEYVNTGECRVNFLCKECDHVWEPEFNQYRPTSCPNCGSSLIFRIGGDGLGKRFIDNKICCPRVKERSIDSSEGNKEQRQ